MFRISITNYLTLPTKHKQIILHTYMLYNLFYLLHSVIIQDKNILLMTYNDNLTINDIKYRESSIPPRFNGVFALEVNKGSYALNATNLTLKTFDNYEVLPVENTLAKNRSQLMRMPQLHCAENYLTKETINQLKKEIGISN